MSYRSSCKEQPSAGITQKLRTKLPSDTELWFAKNMNYTIRFALLETTPYNALQLMLNSSKWKNFFSE